MNQKIKVVKQIDKKVAPFKGLISARPKEGWIRTIRTILGLTLEQQARKLSVSKSRVVDIENREVDGAITLKSMQSVADSFNCQFAYCFIPNESFEKIVREQAELIAKQMVKRTHRTMSLEDQASDQEEITAEISEITEELLRGNWKKIWENAVV